jgi:DNA primase
MRTEDILEKFRNVRRQGKGYIASCPNESAHKNRDNKPSLSISHKDGKTLMYCFRCGKEGTSNILNSAGLNWKDLYHE